MLRLRKIATLSMILIAIIIVGCSPDSAYTDTAPSCSKRDWKHLPTMTDFSNIQQTVLRCYDHLTFWGDVPSNIDGGQFSNKKFWSPLWVWSVSWGADDGMTKAGEISFNKDGTPHEMSVEMTNDYSYDLYLKDIGQPEYVSTVEREGVCRIFGFSLPSTQWSAWIDNQTGKFEIDDPITKVIWTDEISEFTFDCQEDDICIHEWQDDVNYCDLRNE